MIASKAHAKQKLFWFVAMIAFATVYFFASQRKVIQIQQLDVHTGAIRVETRHYWGDVTYESKKPWREDDLKKLFPDAPGPRWLPTSISEHRVLPDLSRSGRRQARRGQKYGLSNYTGPVFIRTNLSQVLNAPHLSDSTRRDLIYLSFDPATPDEPTSNFHMLDVMRQEVVNVTAFPEVGRAEWQDKIDRDDAGDITRFLKEARKYPAKPDS